MVRELIVISICLCTSSLLSGCSTVSFYSQSIVGHLNLMSQRVPLQALDPDDTELQEKIVLVREIKQFASQQLLLPNNDSYQSYVALQKKYPVWNVVAAPKLSVDAHHWCYPIAGCAPYRGYFKQSKAKEYAEYLNRKGFDVTVSGAIAYSTLGWFADPLLPTMMRYGDTYLAEIIFHELAHQKLYVKGQSEFNEAFATFVAEQGVRQWLQQTRPQQLSEYEASLQRQQAFTDLLLKTKSELRKVYESEMSDTQKLQHKQQAFQRLQTNYQALRQSWNGYDGFDHWFVAPLNNAKLVSVSTYRGLLSQLQQLFDDCGGKLTVFYRSLESQKIVLREGKVATSCGVSDVI